MLRFFHSDLSTSEIHLSEKEAHHASRVLRLKEGDTIQLLNGLGDKAVGTITFINKNKVTVEVTEKQHFEQPQQQITLAVAPPKSTDRWEFILEKATEIGVHSIQPIICFHSERKKINLEKAQWTMIAALKQSGNPYLPLLHEPLKFNQWVNQNNSPEKYIAYCPTPHTNSLIQAYQNEVQTSITIGPEGDFSREEIALAVEQYNFQPVSLGKHILRAETAAITSVIQLQSIYKTV